MLEPRVRVHYLPVGHVARPATGRRSEVTQICSPRHDEPGNEPVRSSSRRVRNSDVVEEPRTAEALMRSRFEAFGRADSHWLLRTWHTSTRPEELDLSANPRWRGVQIITCIDGGEDDDTGIVEFRATYVMAGDLRILHERSRFVREDGRWFYVDGDLL